MSAAPAYSARLQVKSDFMTHSMQQQLALRNLKKEAMLMSKLRHPNGAQKEPTFHFYPTTFTAARPLTWQSACPWCWPPLHAAPACCGSQGCV